MIEAEEEGGEKTRCLKHNDKTRDTWGRQATVG